MAKRTARLPKTRRTERVFSTYIFRYEKDDAFWKSLKQKALANDTSVQAVIETALRAYVQPSGTPSTRA